MATRLGKVTGSTSANLSSGVGGTWSLATLPEPQQDNFREVYGDRNLRVEKFRQVIDWHSLMSSQPCFSRDPRTDKIKERNWGLASWAPKSNWCRCSLSCSGDPRVLEMLGLQNSHQGSTRYRMEAAWVWDKLCARMHTVVGKTGEVGLPKPFGSRLGVNPR